VPFVPNAVGKTSSFRASSFWPFLSACAFFIGPFGPGWPAGPDHIQVGPRPDFFFLWLYATLSYLPPSLRDAGAADRTRGFVVPGVDRGSILAEEGEKSWKRRPLAGHGVILVAVGWASLTHLGLHTPWSPEMDAVERTAIPDKYLEHRTALERQGALASSSKQCRNCHALEDSGGKLGRPLDAVAVRRRGDQLIAR